MNESDYINDELTTFTICTNQCEHSNGWWGSINVELFWGLLNKTVKIYNCSDCGKVLYGKELKEFNAKCRLQ